MFILLDYFRLMNVFTEQVCLYFFITTGADYTSWIRETVKLINILLTYLILMVIELVILNQ